MKGWPLQLEPAGISLMNLTILTAERKTENESHAYNLLQNRLTSLSEMTIRTLHSLYPTSETTDLES